ncbi:hypothetical protein OEA41_000680 [Lepraria neglecta]|uniref:FAD dependent oxidoreductase domain-containing protein n=1 Tax=Lepraria neglecta TaxID=209136 RepID=A0AAE0DRH5_9LECA|nr:hypothetical protein OEA41_000680 [Lepraria neglecta]
MIIKITGAEPKDIVITGMASNPGITVKSYEESGSPSHSAQVNPFIFTKTLAALAVESGANIVIGSATAINYGDDGKAIKSVQYLDSGTSKTLVATDVLISAGPWTPKIFPRAHLGAPRGRSIVVRPSKGFSPFVLDANIGPAPHGPLKDDLFLEIFPRPGDELNDFDIFSSCGLDDYDVRLPATGDSVEVDEESCNDIWETLRSVSQDTRRRVNHKASVL